MIALKVELVQALALRVIAERLEQGKAGSERGVSAWPVPALVACCLPGLCQTR
jgi:hypothetical protein